MTLQSSRQIDVRRDSGVGRWLQEIAWRDFYTDILAAHPRVSMGRPYLEKFASVVWENHEITGDIGTDGIGEAHRESESLQRWKEGMTGVPIVDAAMRCIKEIGWMHNRLRMVSAMYLTKDLMIDWRVGERVSRQSITSLLSHAVLSQYFMEQLIDGDLASNNGGWQWCASTGVDSCPYFRIFNPYSQSSKASGLTRSHGLCLTSHKADPTGAFIRHWIPELRELKGPGKRMTSMTSI
jgi:deoxyribodipyrimidine photo-lyase